MKISKIKIYSYDEWKTIVQEHFQEMITQWLPRHLEKGEFSQIIPKAIMERGINGLSDKELLDVMADYIGEVLMSEVGDKQDLVGVYFLGMDGELIPVLTLDEIDRGELVALVERGYCENV
jgi:hypothetical protein